MTQPKTIEECDHELVQYRKAIRLVSVDGRVAVWEQIDRILEIRYLLQRASVKRARRIRPSQR